jgi:hypothetical protein
VVHQHVAAPDHGEDVLLLLRFPLVAKGLGYHRLPCLVTERRQIQIGQLRAVRQVDQPVALVHLLRLHLQLAHQQPAHLQRHVPVHLQPHRRGEAPLAQLLGDHRKEVFRLVVVARHVGVAGDAEGIHRHHLHPPEERSGVGLDHVLHGDEVEAVLGVRNGDPASRARGDLDAREVHGAARAVAQQDRQRQAQVRDEGEGVPGVDGERGEHGVELLAEEEIQPRALPLVQLGVARHQHPRLGAQEGDQLALPDGAHGGVHHQPRVRDELELLAGGAPVQRQRLHPGRDLPPQPAHALLKELVQVAGGDRQEAHALQERNARVGGLVEHAPVEVQQPQLAVEVERGVVQLRPVRHLARRHGARHPPHRLPRRHGLRRRLWDGRVGDDGGAFLCVHDRGGAGMMPIGSTQSTRRCRFAQALIRQPPTR